MPFTRNHPAPKRIALFSGNYNCVVDGANRALNQLVAYLGRRGVNVRVFAPTCKTPAFKPAGKLTSVPSLPIPGRSEYRVAWRLTPALKRDLLAFNPDLIHLSAPDLLGYSTLKWARATDIPVVASFHTRFDTYPRYYKSAWLEKYLVRYMGHFYRQCDQVYSPSDCIDQFLEGVNVMGTVRRWGRGIDNSLFNPYKRDIEWRRSLGIKDDEKVLLFVGRLVLEKGLDIYADTIDRLEKSGLRFKAMVVGDGPERERFGERLPNAIFTGFLNGEMLAKAYASSDIFVNPSVTETFGNVTLEAMASGLSVVCADASGARALVTNEQEGFLVDPRNIDAYAHAIGRLIQNPKLYENMQAAGLERGRGLGWDRVLGGLYDHYAELLDAKHTAARVWRANGPRHRAATLNHTNN